MQVLRQHSGYVTVRRSIPAALVMAKALLPSQSSLVFWGVTGKVIGGRAYYEVDI